MLLQNNATVLFQGDSITDCYRTSFFQDGRFFGEEDLGVGYPKTVSSVLAAKYPSLNIRYYNRAVSGNRSIDLVNRWKEDCLDLHPDVLVIMVGINDVWRKFDSADPTSTEQFIKNYRYLLESAKAQNENLKIVVVEPAYCNVPCEHTKEFRAELLDKIEALRQLVKELRCWYIPLDGLIAAKSMRDDFTKWIFDDGVHLTSMGHGLLARELIRLFEEN